MANGCTFLEVLLAIVLPPLGVFLRFGCCSVSLPPLLCPSPMFLCPASVSACVPWARGPDSRYGSCLAGPRSRTRPPRLATFELGLVC